MYVYIYIHIHTYIHAYIHTYIYINICTYIYRSGIGRREIHRAGRTADVINRGTDEGTIGGRLQVFFLAGPRGLERTSQDQYISIYIYM